MASHQHDQGNQAPAQPPSLPDRKGNATATAPNPQPNNRQELSSVWATQMLSHKSQFDADKAKFNADMVADLPIEPNTHSSTSTHSKAKKD
ncbi:hypothetical protein H4R35_005708 [Dimargaris xerosporica]|nr:hypothetical protein H4R35_005708 [Dimargaris xerosporica]